MSTLSSVLVVDDEPDNFDVIETLLHDMGYQLYYASNGRRALERLDSYHPDVILLDVMMPEMDGIEVCRRIKANPRWRPVPIIMVTALTAREDLARCIAAGADDFISKPVNSTELRARIQSMLRLHQQYRKIQKLYLQVHETNQKLSQFNTQLEKQVRQRTMQLEKAIAYDTLTELPSRTSFLKKVYMALEYGPELSSTGFAVCYLDCNRFKLVNNSLGYDVGDRLLIAIGQRLAQQLRPGDMLARAGADEFCIFIDQVQNQADALPVIQQILHSFRYPFQIDQYEIHITISIGVVLSADHYQRPEDILRDADTAMYKAKMHATGTYQFFDYNMHSATVERLQLENDLQRALNQQEFRVYYQPMFHLNTRQVFGFEALVRWQHPERGLIPPGVFIPCAEDTGLIVPIGLLVLEQACQQLHNWEHQGFSDLIVSVNLSTRQFAYPSLLDDIDHILTKTGASATRLKLEITESAIMDNPQIAIDITRQLRARSIQLSIDDFGTGYSSLGYLTQFPVDTLKLERSFIQEMITSTQNAEVVRAVVALGHALNMKVVAEGIETEEQHMQLQAIGCTYGQGYYFSHPLPPESLTEWLTVNYNQRVSTQ